MLQWAGPLAGYAVPTEYFRVAMRSFGRATLPGPLDGEANMVRITLAAGIATLLAGCATWVGTYSAPATISDGVLTGPNGMSLYTFDRDQAGAGRSVCNAQCAVNWPPFLVSGGTATGEWTVIRRDDGKDQWAYKGKPLYYWIRDQKPGDRTGDGVNGVWRVARP